MASHFSRCCSLIDCQLVANGFNASCCGAVNRFHAEVPVVIGCCGAAVDAAPAILGASVTVLAASGSCWALQVAASNKNAAIETSTVSVAS